MSEVTARPGSGAAPGARSGVAPEAGTQAAPQRPSEQGADGYKRGARLLSIGIGTTGLVTFAYFALASHNLTPVEYKQISLLWSILFVIVSVLYRPIEQLLSRTIADRRARGLDHGHPVRVPLAIQGSFALAFLVVALILRPTIEQDVFDGSAALFWVLVAGVLAYAASYFARGFLAGHQLFGLYGGLVFLEATSRCMFALAVAVGIASGQTAVALGMAAAPLVSLVVVPWAFSRRSARTGGAPPAAATGVQSSTAAVGGEAAGSPPTDDALEPAAAPAGQELSMARGGRFALAVFVVMLAEQTLLNAAVLTVDATSTDRAVAGYVFNVLLIARSPLQLFQAIQGSLLPHLAGLEAREGRDEFARAIRMTVIAIVGFAALVAVGLLAIGPFAMDVLFGSDIEYPRVGLALVAVGMGAHLTAGTLNQAALARDRAAIAAGAWLLSAALFVGWTLSSVVDDALLRAELGYAGAAGVLCVLLFLVYRRPPHPPAGAGAAGHKGRTGFAAPPGPPV